jgi:hypothetical protein
MGSSSRFHGLTGVKQRQPKSNVAKRVRNDRLVAAKQPLLAEIRKTLKDTPEVV